jgi:hypothetical protein
LTFPLTAHFARLWGIFLGFLKESTKNGVSAGLRDGPKPDLVSVLRLFAGFVCF